VRRNQLQHQYPHAQDFRRTQKRDQQELLRKLSCHLDRPCCARRCQSLQAARCRGAWRQLGRPPQLVWDGASAACLHRLPNSTVWNAPRREVEPNQHSWSAEEAHQANLLRQPRSSALLLQTAQDRPEHTWRQQGQRPPRLARQAAGAWTGLQWTSRTLRAEYQPAGGAADGVRRAPLASPSESLETREGSALRLSKWRRQTRSVSTLSRPQVALVGKGLVYLRYLPSTLLQNAQSRSLEVWQCSRAHPAHSGCTAIHSDSSSLSSCAPVAIFLLQVCTAFAESAILPKQYTSAHLDGARSCCVHGEPIGRRYRLNFCTTATRQTACCPHARSL
jgi:hypothetical protein